MDKQFTRKQYLANECTFREFYGQFVDEETKKELLAVIPLDLILASTDEHLNDIPLKKWDSISGVLFSGSQLISRPRIRKDLADKINASSEGVSPATLVCIYKEQARQLQESNQS